MAPKSVSEPRKANGAACAVTLAVARRNETRVVTFMSNLLMDRFGSSENRVSGYFPWELLRAGRKMRRRCAQLKQTFRNSFVNHEWVTPNEETGRNSITVGWLD